MSLEDTVKAGFDRIRSAAELRAIFDRGFEPDVAARLAARLWDSTSNEPVATDQIIAAPDSVVVLFIEGDSAEVAFVAPLVARVSPEKPYTVAWLRRRGGVWRVGGARDVATLPATPAR